MDSEPFRIRAREVHETGKEVPFDAAEWFETATEQQIREVRSWGYQIVCCELVPGQVHCPGFEVIIEADDAEAWLAKHRPEVLR